MSNVRPDSLLVSFFLYIFLFSRHVSLRLSWTS